MTIPEETASTAPTAVGSVPPGTERIDREGRRRGADGGGGEGGAPGTGRRSEDAAPRPRRSRTRNRVLAVKLGVWALGLTPLTLLGLEAGLDGLGANPIETLLHHFGRWGLVMLLATLAVTPLRRLTGANVLIQGRRPLGLFAFFYLSLHFLTYAVLDQWLAWSYIVEDVVERPFITVGFLAFLLLVPLAVTSTKGWIRRLGKNWTRLHRLVYPAAILGVVHFQWKVKAEEPDPLVFGAVLAGLLLFRLPGAWKKRRRS